MNYVSWLHNKGADRLARNTVAAYEEGLANRPGVAESVWHDEFIAEWDMHRYWIAPLIKHPSFSVENEYRFVYLMFLQKPELILFQPKKSLIARYALFPLAPAGQLLILTITEVMVGPGKHQAEAHRSVISLLKKYGYACDVSLNNSPAQRE